jgi:hypothetical protein
VKFSWSVSIAQGNHEFGLRDSLEGPDDQSVDHGGLQRGGVEMGHVDLLDAGELHG